MSLFYASEINNQETVDALDLELNVLLQDKKYSVELQNVEGVLKDLGFFVMAAIEQIAIDEMAVVVKRISTCSVKLIACLARIVAKCDLLNDAADSMPPVLPHQLMKLCNQEFAHIILKQKDRLSVH